MAAFNKVILLGNLTRDPETRVTPGGLTICKLSLATNRKYKDRDGNDKEEVTYVDIDSFGKQAEILSKFLGRGSPLFIEGRLQLDSWEGPGGEKRSKLKVVLENFQFVGGRGGDSDSSNSGSDYDDSPAPRSQSSSRRGNSAPAVDEDIDDNIPF
jgi:single-strand DNA-binding protein